VVVVCVWGGGAQSVRGGGDEEGGGVHGESIAQTAGGFACVFGQVLWGGTYLSKQADSLLHMGTTRALVSACTAQHTGALGVDDS